MNGEGGRLSRFGKRYWKIFRKEGKGITSRNQILHDARASVIDLSRVCGRGSFGDGAQNGRFWRQLFSQCLVQAGIMGNSN